jgi:hypothetical protein
MTRIRFDISAALARWRARPQAPLRRFRMMDLQSLHEITLGPGWFDSSWDLDRGLAVEVALPGDPPFQAWIEAQARPLTAAAGQAARPLPAEGMLEFEPVDWKAWAPADAVVDPLPASLPAGLELPELTLEPAFLEPAPELELALV